MLAEGIEPKDPPSLQCLLAAGVGRLSPAIAPEGELGRGGWRVAPGPGPGRGPHTQSLCPLFQVHMDTLITKPLRLWNDEFWQSSWDLGGLAVISLFVIMVLFIILFATIFGIFSSSEVTHKYEES